MFRRKLNVFGLAIVLLLFCLAHLGETRVVKSQDKVQTTVSIEAASQPIVVTSKNYSEQLILGKILVALLENKGYDVVDKTGLGNSRVVRAAMEADEVDLYIELTGSALSVYHNLPSAALPTEPEATYKLARKLDLASEIAWLDRGDFNNTYTILVTERLLDQGIDSLDALAVYMANNDSPFSICVESDFYAREQDGLQGMQKRYDFTFKPENIILTDLDGVYDGLRSGECDIAEGYATDGRISTWGFTSLKDSLAFFPFYNPAPVIRQEVLTREPELATILNALPKLLDDDTMRQLNARVDIGADGLFNSGDEEMPEEVANTFIREAGLVEAAPIVVSSKNYSEQIILGQILLQLLEDAGYAVEDKTGIGASRTVRAAMENGEIDLYVELTGSALSVYNGLPAEALPTSAQRSYELAKSLDSKRDIIWLDSGRFNNTYTVMATQRLVDQGVDSLDALADYMNSTDPELSICVESDFYSREQDGFGAFQAHYNLPFKSENVTLTDLDGLYENLRSGECDLAEGYATDGRISAWDFTSLTDSRSFFPFYTPAPVIRQEVLDANPELADLLNQVSPFLDDETMRRLNESVDLGEDGRFGNGDELTPAQAARSFLLDSGLVEPPPIVVSSKNYSEQLILGKLLVNVLQNAGYTVEDKTGLGASRTVRKAMEDDEIDLYYELTGSALAVYNKLPSAALPLDPDRVHTLAKSLDKERGIVWLDRGDFNNTYTIMTTDLLIDAGIDSLNSLADYMNTYGAPFSICVETDFYSRPQDGFAAMQELYGFTFAPDNVILSDLDGVYDGLRNKECDFAEGYATDGRIAAWEFTNIADPLLFFPFYNPAPVVRAEVLKIHPELESVLNPVTQLLDDQTITELNARVDIGADGLYASGDEETPDQVAKSFLAEAGLIQPASIPAKPASAPAADTSDVENEPSAEDDSAEDDSAEDDSAEDDSAEDDSAEDDSAEDDSAEDDSAEDDSAEDSSAEDSSAEDDTVTNDITEKPAKESTAELEEKSAEEEESTEEELAEDELAEEPIIDVTKTDVNTENEELALNQTNASEDAENNAIEPPAEDGLTAKTITVASQDTTVDQLLGQFLVLILDDLGYEVEDKTGSANSATTLRLAVEEGTVDLYPERTNAALTEYHSLPKDEHPLTADEALDLVQTLDESENILWLNTSTLTQYPLLAVSSELAQQGVTTIDALASIMNGDQPDLAICASTSFVAARRTGLYGLQAAYDFRFYTVNIVLVDSDEILDGLYNDQCDVAYGINTDSRLAAWDLTVLDDTRDFFPVQAIAPIGPIERVVSISGFEAKVETLAELLGDNMLRELGSRIEYGEDGEADSADEQSVKEVAALFLCENELILTCADG